MTADGKRRPVSGEMMTPPTGRRPAHARDTVDAELLPTPKQEVGTGSIRRPPGLGMLERNPGAVRATRAGALFWAAGLALAASGFWVSGGHALLRSSFAPTPGGLVITNVQTRVEASAGYSTLIVDGEARNRDGRARPMLPIAIAVRAPSGAVTLYRMSAGGELVAANDIYLFSSRLRVPPEGVKSVVVTLQPAD